MENKLRELTEKIYSEGIEKAKSDAVEILNNAQKEADGIIRKAQMEASEIISKANENAKEIKRNTESEIKLASKQAISKLKQEITEMVLVNSIEKPVRDVLKEKEFVGQ
jgi:V/A-type H+-transporting ATPase subunit E